MRALECADVRELAPEFAFGVLDGEARADVVAHLERCPACRTLVTELSETADSIVLLAPEAEPPPGFERRVLAHLEGGRRRQRWRTVKLVAAVAAAAAILSVVAVRVIDSSRPDATTASASGTVPMVGDHGVHVGQVEAVGHGATTNLTVTVDYALPDGDYRVVLAPESTAHRVLGTMTVMGGRGAWSGTTTSLDGPARVQLVDDAGAVPCSAELPTV